MFKSIGGVLLYSYSVSNVCCTPSYIVNVCRRKVLHVSSARTMSSSNSNRVDNIPNRLINERSPYLLQHAYNPVQWWVRFIKKFFMCYTVLL